MKKRNIINYTQAISKEIKNNEEVRLLEAKLKLARNATTQEIISSLNSIAMTLKRKYKRKNKVFINDKIIEPQGIYLGVALMNKKKQKYIILLEIVYGSIYFSWDTNFNYKKENIEYIKRYFEEQE